MSSQSDRYASYLEGQWDYFEYENLETHFHVVNKYEKSIAPCPNQQQAVQVDIDFACFSRLFLRIPEKLEKPHHGLTEVALVHLPQVFNSVTFKPHQFSNFPNFRRILFNQVVSTWPLQTVWYIIFVKKFWYKLRAIANRMSPNHNLLSLSVDVCTMGIHYLVKTSVFHCIMQELIHDANGVVPAYPNYVEWLLRQRIEEDYNVKEKCCSICLDEFSKPCEIACMPCGHMFHSKCIEEWLSKSHYCPLCRYQVAMFLEFYDRTPVGLQLELISKA